MIDLKTVDRLKQASIEERLRVIELILESLRRDFGKDSKLKKRQLSPFKVRKFHLGQEIHVDRDELYSERG